MEEEMIVNISLISSQPSQRQDNGIEHQSRHRDTIAMMRETQY